ncbi:cytochrome P450 9e2-like [Anticarsia gemmatalis]|uniref:cytochrome P450 9e2-like n=1 Tax=Anticarsia gemmatalis TaxID=129554 RepID=UPI003F75B527
MIILLIWVTALVAAVTLYLHNVYSAFKRRGVKNMTPVPLLGNMARVLLRQDDLIKDLMTLYDAFPEERFVGKFEFLKEIVMIRDLELVKKIALKDFEYFLDHRSFFSESTSYFARNLLSLKGQEWKDMRSTLSPAFTSSKIRLMVPFMVEVGDQMMGSLKQKMKSSNEGYIDIECKDLTTRYANDVIASCAFGLKVDSHYEQNNEFYVMGRNTFQFRLRELITVLALINLPKKISKLLKLDFMSVSSQKFFKKIILETMQDRDARHIIRPDMIHLLMEAKKGKLTHETVKADNETAGFATVDESSVGTKKVDRVWNDDDLIAQAVLFFLAGFETVSTAMSFLLYELACNPEVQEKLATEVKEFDVKNNGKFDLKSIQEMPYMDMVVSELLRKWPPAVALDRVCLKDYDLGKPNEKSDKHYILRKGTVVALPVYAFHHDPQYFPNPEKFDPERFSEENKHSIPPFAYMPFGLGPRNCIGSRFALCEVKVMVYQILRQLELSPCERTCIPAELTMEKLNMELKGGHWLRFKPRN